MTKSIVGFVAVLLTATTVSAQTETTTSPTWRLSSFGINIGTIHDVYQRMNLDMMYDFSQNSALLDRDLTGMDENLYRESSGGRVGLNVTLTADRPNARFGHEIRLGAFFSNREPLISYHEPSESGEFSGRSIIYCNIVNEVSVDGTYLLRRSLGKKEKFSVYAGAGISLGTSFKNQLVVMETSSDTTGTFEPSNDSFYDGKSSLFTRVNVPIGIQANLLNKISFNLEATIGAGMQSVYGGRSYFMPFSGGLRLGLSYNL
jgi:hypothetical protein